MNKIETEKQLRSPAGMRKINPTPSYKDATEAERIALEDELTQGEFKAVVTSYLKSEVGGQVKVRWMKDGKNAFSYTNRDFDKAKALAFATAMIDMYFPEEE